MTSLGLPKGGAYTAVPRSFMGREVAASSFVQAALCELFNVDEVVVVCTSVAWKWTGAEGPGGQGERLRAALAPVTVKHVEIPEGSTPEQLWQQFNTLREPLGYGDSNRPHEVVLDVTHGFRVQPMFSAAAAQWVRMVDATAPAVSVVYGEFSPSQEGPQPIWDVTALMELQAWTHELSTFLRTGRAGALSERLAARGTSDKKVWAMAGRDGAQPRLLDLANALKRVSDDLAHRRVTALLGAGKSVERLLAVLDQAKLEVKESLPALAPVLNDIRTRFEPLSTERVFDSAGVKAMERLAELYCRLDDVPACLSVLREAFVSRYLPAGDDDALLDPAVRKAAEGRAFREGADLFQSIAQARNDLAHAGLRPDAMAGSNARKRAEGLLKRVADYPWPEQVVPLPGEGPAVFVNLSSHGVHTWDEAQHSAALAYADRVVDLPFPRVPPEADLSALNELAEQVVSRVPEGATAAMVHGEATLASLLVSCLQRRGLTCFAATTERHVEELPDGRKATRFSFVAFREYPLLFVG